MLSVSSPPNYALFARMQNSIKSSDDIELISIALEQLMLQHLPKRSHILDLGCGTAQLLQELQIKGYRTTGVDACEELLQYARKNAPKSELILSDIRKFNSPSTFNGVFSRDTLLFILSLEELTVVFQNIYAALRSNGLFVFTIQVVDWPSFNSQSTQVSSVKDECAWIQSFNYNPAERIWEIKVTGFELLEGIWQRSDTTWQTKSYLLAEIQSTLKNVGFTEIKYYDPKDFGDSSSEGDLCFVCRKP
jgi:SAM-dependent methyltransferase